MSLRREIGWEVFRTKRKHSLKAKRMTLNPQGKSIDPAFSSQLSGRCNSPEECAECMREREKRKERGRREKMERGEENTNGSKENEKREKEIHGDSG